MPPTPLNEVVEDINRRVDPRFLLERIEYYSDAITAVGVMLKAYCPIHQDTKTRTFTVDLNKRTFKCLYRPCPGYRGGSLVEFFGLYQGIASPLQAALALAKFVGLELEPPLLARLCAQFVEEGRKALEQGRLEEANESVVHALEVSPESVDAHLLASQLAQVRGAVGEAIEHAQRAAALAESQGDLPTAITILTDQVLELLPEDEENLLHLADLHEAVGQIGQCVTLLLRLAREREQRAQPDSAIPLLMRVLSHQPDRYDSRLALARALEGAGDPEQAAEHFLMAVDLLEQDDKPEAAFETLLHIRDLQPTHWGARERLVERLQQKGDTVELSSELLAMAGLALECGEIERAERHATRMIETDPKSVLAREIRAQVYCALGEMEAFARENLALADLYEEQGAPENVVAALEAAREAQPQDLSIRERLIEQLLAMELDPRAGTEMLGLALLAFEHGDAALGANTLDRLAALNPDDLETRRRIVEVYEQAGLTDRAGEECALLAKRLGEATLWEDSLEFADVGLRLHPEAIAPRRARIEALRALDRTDETLDEYRTLIDKLLTAGDDPAAERAIEEALQLDDERVELHRMLADLYLRTQREAEARIALRNLTRILHRQGDADGLIETCDRLLALDDDDRTTRALLAEQYLGKGLAAEASEEFEKVGDQYEEAGEFEQAIQHYERVLDIDPGALGVLRKTTDLVAEHDSLEDAKPYFHKILDVVRRQEDPAALEREYHAILDRLPDWSELRQEYAEWLMQGEDREAAYAQFLALAEDLADRQGDLESAARVYGQLIEYDADRIEFRLGLGRLYERLGESAKAAETKRDAADRLLSVGRSEEASDLLGEIVRLVPSDESARLRLAEVCRSLGKTEEAVEQLEEVASLRRSQEREEENIGVYRDILAIDEGRTAARRRLAEALENSGLPGEAAEEWLALAQTLAASGQSQEAIDVCRHVVEIEPDTPAPRLHLVGLLESLGDNDSLKEELDGLVALYRSQGELDAATDILRRMIELDPADLTLPERMGRTMEEKGEGEEACSLYFETAARHRDQAEEAMARALLVRVKTLQPENTEARLLLAAVCEALGDARSAAREYLDLTTMAFEREDREEAERCADHVTRLADEDWDLVIELAHGCSRHQNHEIALKQLTTAIEKARDTQDIDGGLTLTREAIGLNPDARILHEHRIAFLLLAERPEDAAEEYRTLADLAEREQDPEAAALYYQSVLEIAPKDAAAHLHLADLMIHLGEKDEAIRELTLGVALQAEEGRLEDAIETASRILEMDEANEAVRATRADLRAKSGRTEEAVEDLDALADNATRADDWEKAETYFRRLLKLSPDSLDAVRKLARVVLEHRPLAEARPILQRRLEIAQTLLPPNDLVQEYEEILELDPQNPEFHLEFARVLRDQAETDRAVRRFLKTATMLREHEDPERALETLDELCAFAPEPFDAMERQAAILLEMHRPDEARRKLVEAGEGLIAQGALAQGVGAFLQALEVESNDETLLTRVAGLYEDSGATAQARDLYLRIATLQEEDGAYEESIPTFEKILSLEPSDLETRRRLADILELLDRPAKAVEQWLAFAETAEEQGETEKALSACLHVKEIDTEECECRRRLIRLYRALDKPQAAKRETLELADAREKAGAAEEVETLLAQMIETDPADRSLRARQAEFLAGLGRLDEAADAFSTLARLSLDEDDSEAAIGAYRRIVAFNPADLDVRERIVEILEMEDRADEAAEEALALAMAHVDNATLDRAEIWADKAADLDKGSPSRCLAAADAFREHGFNEESRRFLLRRAQMSLKAETPEDADAILEHALKHDPGHADLLAARLGTLSALGNTVAAVEVCKTLADLQAEAGDAEAEEATRRQALQLAPDDIEAHEGLIALLERLGPERAPDTVQALAAVSALHLAGGRADRAIECHRRGLELDPGRDDLREALAQMLLDAGDWPTALEEFLELAGRCFENGNLPQAQAFYVKSLELDQENLDALRKLIQVTHEQNDHAGHIRYGESLAGIYIQASALGDAIQCYRELLDFSPDHQEGRETLGGLLEQEERIDEAVEVWRELTEQYERAGDAYAAIENLQKIERHKPTDIETARKLADLFASTQDPAAPQRYERVVVLCEEAGDSDAAAQAAGILVELAPDDPSTHRTLGRLASARGDTDEAVAAYRRAASLHESSDDLAGATETLGLLLEIDPTNRTERERYAKLLQAQGEDDRAVEQLLVLADIYEESKEFPGAIAQCRAALAIDAGAFEAHSRLANYHIEREEVAPALTEITWLADYHAERDENAKARELLETGLRLDPQNMPILERLAEIHLQAGEMDEATNHYLRLAEAALVCGDLQRATQAMELARDCSPDDVEIRRNLAEIYVRQGDNASARSEFFEVSRLYLAQGLVADARGMLDALIIQTPKDVELRGRIADLYVQHGIPELAALQYVELARLRQQDNDPEAVMQYAREALALKPRTIEAKELLVEAQIQLADLDGAFDTYSDLADLYAQTGQPEKAAACLRPIIEMKPEEPHPRLRLIEVLERLNRPEQAVEEMRQLATIHAEAGDIEEAVVVYRRILETRPDDTRARIAFIQAYSQIGPERDLVEDYMKLAEIFRERTDVPAATDAFEKALAIAPEVKEHRETFVGFLLATQQIERARQEADTLSLAYMEGGENKEAMALLQKVLKQAPDNTDLRLRLAETHSRLNARGMALKELRVVAKAYEKQNNTQGLVETYKQILDIDPQNVDTRQQIIELLESLERHDDAAEQRMALADVYVGRGLLDLARDEYRTLVQLESENFTAWNYLVAIREQLGDEDGLADDYVALGKLYRDLEQEHNALDSFRKAVETDHTHLEARKRYIEVAKKTCDETELVDDYLALADILLAQGKVDDAVEVYTHVMRLDPANDTARQKLVDTQARRAGMTAGSASTAPKSPATARPESAPTTPSALPTRPPTETQKLQPDEDDPKPPPSAAEAEIDEMEELAEEEAGLEQVVANYQDILQVNPQNANVRLKLADLYEQMGRVADALVELTRASEIFFQKSELNMCVTVCERILAKDPSNGKVRERLSKAVLKRDAFKALESAILFSDQIHPDTDSKRSESSDTL